MAKRYINWELLQELASTLPASGHYKPSGTMGIHHCIIVPNPDGTLTVNGSAHGTVVLSEGDTLGYDCGEVWALRKPTDPLGILRRRDRIMIGYGELPQSFSKSSRYEERDGCGAGARSEDYHFYAIGIDGTEEEIQPLMEPPVVTRHEWVTTTVYNEQWEVPSGTVAILETYTLQDPTRKSGGYKKLWLGSASRNSLNAWAQKRLSNE